MSDLLAIRIGTMTCKQGEMFAPSSTEGALTPLPRALCNRPALLNTCDPDATIQYDCLAFLVRSDERLVLIDPGFDNPLLAEQMECSAYHPIEEMLARINVQTSKITDVILSHAHWLNIGSLQHFLKARVYISIRELNAMERALEGSRNCRLAYRFEDMRNLGRVSRLRMVKRGQAVTENVRVDVIGGHTQGHLLVTYMVDGKSRVLLAGDNAPLYRHLQGENLPEGWCAGDEGARERLKSRCYYAFALPGRDPQIMKRYPEIAPGIVRIMGSEFH